MTASKIKLRGSRARASEIARWRIRPRKRARGVAFYGICMVLIYRLTKAGDAFAGERKNGVPVDGTNDNKISILTNIRPPKNSQNSAERLPPPLSTSHSPPPSFLSESADTYIPGGPMINGSRRLCRLCEKLQSSPYFIPVSVCVSRRTQKREPARARANHVRGRLIFQST